jgi:hypothetical protein
VGRGETCSAHEELPPSANVRGESRRLYALHVEVDHADGARGRAFIIGGALGLLSIFAVAYARKTGKIPMHDPSIWILVTYGAAGIIVNLIGAGYLSFSLSSVLPLWHRVFYFHKYAKGLPDDVRDKGAEKLAHEMRPYS